MSAWTELADVVRETVVERTMTISLEDLRSWLKHASYHVRLAVAIAALAPSRWAGWPEARRIAA